MRKKLPIGIQSFRRIREEDYLYVDKTEYVFKLLNSANFVFLSRPRRFGKTLTLDTIKYLFLGKKSYFEGLWIYEHWDWSVKLPVVHLRLNSIGYHSNKIEDNLLTFVQAAAKENNIQIQAQKYDLAFRELLQKLIERDGSLVLLIDEYDKPITDFLDKKSMHRAIEHRAVLAEFYGMIKPLSDGIRFFMMTGVSKFSQVNLFSKLNILTDISLKKEFAALTGYIQAEVESNFGDWIDHAHKQHLYMGRSTFLDQIKQWYNGYSWDGQTRVYNPISLMQFLDEGQFADFWFDTGTPTLLVDILSEKKEYRLDNFRISTSAFKTFDLENLDLRTLMFQTGYLTIERIDWMHGAAWLCYPNREVEMAFSNHVIGAMLGRSYLDANTPILDLREAFLDNDVERAINIIKSLLKGLPAHLIGKQEEKFYHALVHLHFNYLGMMMESEVHTSDGRMDAVVTTPSHIYIFEFKINQSAAAALKQIEEKKYADRYMGLDKKIVGIGVNFDTATRSVDDWARAEIDS